MGSPITFGGFNNIDFSLVLNAIMQQERAPLTALETQRTTPDGPEYGLCHVRQPHRRARKRGGDAGQDRRPLACRGDGQRFERCRNFVRVVDDYRPLRDCRHRFGPRPGDRVGHHLRQRGRHRRHVRCGQPGPLLAAAHRHRRDRGHDPEGSRGRHQQQPGRARHRHRRPGDAGAIPARAHRPRHRRRERASPSASRRRSAAARGSRSSTPTTTVCRATPRPTTCRRRATPAPRSTAFPSPAPRTS